MGLRQNIPVCDFGLISPEMELKTFAEHPA